MITSFESSVAISPIGDTIPRFGDHALLNSARAGESKGGLVGFWALFMAGVVSWKTGLRVCALVPVTLAGANEGNDGSASPPTVCERGIYFGR